MMMQVTTTHGQIVGISSMHEVVPQATQSLTSVPQVNMVMQGGGVKQEKHDTVDTCSGRRFNTVPSGG